MRISYDPEADAIYIHFPSNGVQVADTREVTEEILVDVDDKQNIIGVEVLFASKQIPAAELASITIEGLAQLTKAASFRFLLSPQQGLYQSRGVGSVRLPAPAGR